MKSTMKDTKETEARRQYNKVNKARRDNPTEDPGFQQLLQVAQIHRLGI